MESLKNITITEEHTKALNYVMKKSFSDNILFVSGKPGVGKSVLIRYLQSELKKARKNVVTIAPTGSAAINVSGQTIHSFFGIRIGIHNPYHSRPSKKLLAMAKKLDVLIIDEVSMVRADVIDEIDHKLRMAKGNRLPFGGIKVVLVGDLFQVENILNKNEEDIFYKHLGYTGRFFFSAKVMIENDYKVLVLDHVYRQGDIDFKNALNDIRLGVNLDEALGFINRNAYGVNAEFSKIPRDVTITSLNADADKINKAKLNEIDSELKIYKGKRGENFKAKILTPDDLHLKVGAQAMITVNDPENNFYSNGDICRVLELNNSWVKVKVLSNNKTVILKPIEFESKEFELIGGEIKEITSDKFIQIPLTLGWAFSIHKSQGLTIPSLAIDTGGKVFAAGIICVALSRATQIKHCEKTGHGLTLLRPIRKSEVIVNQDVIKYYETIHDKII